MAHILILGIIREDLPSQSSSLCPVQCFSSIWTMDVQKELPKPSGARSYTLLLWCFFLALITFLKQN